MDGTHGSSDDGREERLIVCIVSEIGPAPGVGRERLETGVKPRIRLLIADDRPQSRDGLRALLATWPEVDVVGEAADGREAVGLAEKLRPDVVLMDVRMPVMNGLEAARAIKSRWPKVRIVVLTVYADYRADALSVGADAFMVKGCPTEQLLAAIADPDAAPGG